MKSNESASERGQTTLEYMLVFAFVMSISIYFSIGMINVLRKWVAVLAVKTAIFLTGS